MKKARLDLIIKADKSETSTLFFK